MKSKIFRWAWLMLDVRTRTALYDALQEYVEPKKGDNEWQLLKRYDALALKKTLIKD